MTNLRWGDGRRREAICRWIVLLCAAMVMGLAAKWGRAQGGASSNSQDSRPAPQWTYDSYFNPQRQKPIISQTAGVTLSLKTHGDCQGCPSGKRFVFELRRKGIGEPLDFRLENLTAQVDEAHILDSRRAIIVGRATSNTSVVTVVDLRAGKVIDSLVCLRPSLSPDFRFLAFVRFFPDHGAGWPSFQYMVYDLAQPPEANRVEGVAVSNPYDAGIPVYPDRTSKRLGPNVLSDEEVTHSMACGGFYWLDPHQFAFVDRWQESNRLILVDLHGGANYASLTVKPIDTSDVVDLSLCSDAQPADFKRWSDRPENLIVVASIEAPKEKEGFLRLHFRPTSPCLKRTTLDIAVGRPISISQHRIVSSQARKLPR